MTPKGFNDSCAAVIPLADPNLRISAAAIGVRPSDLPVVTPKQLAIDGYERPDETPDRIDKVC